MAPTMEVSSVHASSGVGAPDAGLGVSSEVSCRHRRGSRPTHARNAAGCAAPEQHRGCPYEFMEASSARGSGTCGLADGHQPSAYIGFSVITDHLLVGTQDARRCQDASG